MGRLCFIPNCGSSYTSPLSKISLFKAPSNEELLLKWRTAIPWKGKELTSKDTLCELHFEKKQIVREWTAEYNGKVLMRVPRRALLVKDAIPTIFPETLSGSSVKTEDHGACSNEFITETDVNKSSESSLVLQVCPPDPTEILKLNQITKSKIKSERKSDMVIKNGENQHGNGFLSNSNLSADCSKKPSFKVNELVGDMKSNPLNNLNEVRDTSVSPLTSIKVEWVNGNDDLHLSPFEKLCNCVDGILLPSKAWGVQKRLNDFSNFVNFYECVFSIDNRGYILKQVTIKEDLRVEVYILRQPLNHEFHQLDENLCNIGEFQQLLFSVNQLRVCAGGPYVGSFKDVEPRTAFLDISNVWRHMRCDIIVTDVRQCHKCFNLESTFRAQMKRKQEKFKTDISISDNPTIKKPCRPCSRIRRLEMGP